MLERSPAVCRCYSPWVRSVGVAPTYVAGIHRLLDVSCADVGGLLLDEGSAVAEAGVVKN